MSSRRQILTVISLLLQFTTKRNLICLLGQGKCQGVSEPLHGPHLKPFQRSGLSAPPPQSAAAGQLSINQMRAFCADRGSPYITFVFLSGRTALLRR